MFSLYSKRQDHLARKAQKKTLRIISLLMLFSQALLLLFVTQWIRAQYREQERRLNNDLQNIFTHTGQRLSDSLLDQTVSIILRTPGDRKVHGMEFQVSGSVTGAPEDIKDSAVMHFQLSPNEVKDSNISMHPQSPELKTGHIMVKRFPKEEIIPDNMKKVFRVALLQTANAHGVPENIFATAVDSKLFSKEFAIDLAKKKYPFPVYIDSTAYTPGKFFSYRPDMPKAMPIAVSGYGMYLFNAILPQAAFSLLLLLLTAAAFWLAYRNMKQQAVFSMQKDSMISNISHELKTPVATTRVALEALSSFNAIDDPVRTRKYLQVAEWEMKRLENMIDKVMNIMQTEAGNIMLQKESADIIGILKDITGILEPVLSDRNIMLKEKRTGEDFFAIVDKTHLTGALYNILDNAMKYGGDTISIDINAGREAIHIGISDNGPGIAQAYHKKIFDHFFRIPSGDQHNVKGHGLGLSYARHIIEAHGGTLSLDSREGAGATFLISLPKNYTV